MAKNKKKINNLEENRFSNEAIMEILVTAFVIIILTFFFIKILFF